MAWFQTGGGGIKSDDVTATKAMVLASGSTLTSDSDDEVVQGELPLSAVLAANGGSIQTWDGSVT